MTLHDELSPGDGAPKSYGPAHVRAKRVLPRVCAFCGDTTDRLEVALRHDADSMHLRVDQRNGLTYSVSVDDYMRLCRTCHVRYDAKARRR